MEIHQSMFQRLVKAADMLKHYNSLEANFVFLPEIFKLIELSSKVKNSTKWSYLGISCSYELQFVIYLEKKEDKC